MSDKSSLNVVLVHPEMIIGGAERLMLDIALGLQRHKHRCTFYVGYHNRNNCFAETIDGTINVKRRGHWIPKTIFGKFHAFLSIFRMIYVSLLLCIETLFTRQKIDVIICDQVSICIPILKLLRKPIFFYCHFPDSLQSKPSNNILKKAYRYVIDHLEVWTMNMADGVAVNSCFTQSRFKEAFPAFTSSPLVLYPPVNTSSGQNFLKDRRKGKITALPENIKNAILGASSSPSASSSSSSTKNEDMMDSQPPFVFLSINRFETKKNIKLALDAYKAGEFMAPGFHRRSILILAGGYDPKNVDNAACLKALKKEAAQLEAEGRVLFLTSFSNEQKEELLGNAGCLLYTPTNEHFGIVPVEAMSFGLPVIAVDSGGPKESIDNGKTGYLCQSNPQEFAGWMVALAAKDPNELLEMGERGIERAKTLFSLQQFGDKINIEIEKLAGKRSKQGESSKKDKQQNSTKHSSKRE